LDFFQFYFGGEVLNDAVNRIVMLIDNRGMTAKELCERLKLDITTVSSWKKGKSKPTIETLIGISSIFGVSIDWLLTGDEHNFPSTPAIIKPLGGNDEDDIQFLDKLKKKIENTTDLENYLLDNFRDLPLQHRKKLVDASVLMLDIVKKNAAAKAVAIAESVVMGNMEDEDSFIEMPTSYASAVAAGNGQMLQEEDFDKVRYPVSEVPHNADFAVRIAGDSMEPEFFDGEIAWVKSIPYTNIGEVGIYAVNGDSFIKQHGKNGLISFNKKYKPIKLSESDHVHTFGKVVGKTSHYLR